MRLGQSHSNACVARPLYSSGHRVNVTMATHGKSIAVVLFLITLTVACCNGKVQTVEKNERGDASAVRCAGDTYPPPHKDEVDSFVINLDDPPAYRWSKLMIAKRKQVHDLIDSMKNITRQAFRGYLFHLVDVYFPYLAKTLPYPYYDELTGVAAAVNVSLGEITMYNVVYELFAFCTSIVAEDRDGRLYHARNLDFGLLMGWDFQNHTWDMTEYLKPLVVNLKFQKNGTTIYKAASMAGYIGILTAVKPNKFTLSVNERFRINGGYVGVLEWLLGFRGDQWMGFLTREVMETADSYDQALKQLAKTKLLAPLYFILGGNKAEQASVVTRGRSSFDIWPLGQPSKTQNSTWYLLQTNYDHWEKAPFFDDRRTPGVTCMDQQTMYHVDFPDLYNVLSTVPVLNELTVHTSLMQVNAGSLETYIRHCPSPCNPW